MKPSKSSLSPKTFLRWALLIVGFYIFYLFTYLLLVKSILSQMPLFLAGQSEFWKGLKAEDAFWYTMFLLGLLFSLYLLTLFVSFAPQPKVAALIYLILILVTQGLLLVALPADIKLVPHLFINGVFTLVLLLTLWKKPSLV